jgi:hypothetical protein
MNRLTQTGDFENTLDSMIDAFFHTFDIVSILRKAGAYKNKGIAVKSIFKKLFCLVFLQKSMFMEVGTSNNTNFRKDTFYRFLNS